MVLFLNRCFIDLLPNQFINMLRSKIMIYDSSNNNKPTQLGKALIILILPLLLQILIRFITLTNSLKTLQFVLDPYLPIDVVWILFVFFYNKVDSILCSKEDEINTLREELQKNQVSFQEISFALILADEKLRELAEQNRNCGSSVSCRSSRGIRDQITAAVTSSISISSKQSKDRTGDYHDDDHDDRHQHHGAKVGNNDHDVVDTIDHPHDEDDDDAEDREENSLLQQSSIISVVELNNEEQNQSNRIITTSNITSSSSAANVKEEEIVAEAKQKNDDQTDHVMMEVYYDTEAENNNPGEERTTVSDDNDEERSQQSRRRSDDNSDSEESTTGKKIKEMRAWIAAKKKQYYYQHNNTTATVVLTTSNDGTKNKVIIGRPDNNGKQEEDDGGSDSDSDGRKEEGGDDDSSSQHHGKQKLPSSTTNKHHVESASEEYTATTEEEEDEDHDDDDDDSLSRFEPCISSPPSISDDSNNESNEQEPEDSAKESTVESSNNKSHDDDQKTKELNSSTDVDLLDIFSSEVGSSRLEKEEKKGSSDQPFTMDVGNMDQEQILQFWLDHEQMKISEDDGDIDGDCDNVKDNDIDYRGGGEKSTPQGSTTNIDIPTTSTVSMLSWSQEDNDLLDSLLSPDGIPEEDETAPDDEQQQQMREHKEQEIQDTIQEDPLIDFLVLSSNEEQESVRSNDPLDPLEDQITPQQEDHTIDTTCNQITPQQEDHTIDTTCEKQQQQQEEVESNQENFDNCTDAVVVSDGDDQNVKDEYVPTGDQQLEQKECNEANGDICVAAVAVDDGKDEVAVEDDEENQKDDYVPPDWFSNVNKELERVLDEAYEELERDSPTELLEELEKINASSRSILQDYEKKRSQERLDVQLNIRENISERYQSLNNILPEPVSTMELFPIDEEREEQDGPTEKAEEPPSSKSLSYKKWLDKEAEAMYTTREHDLEQMKVYSEFFRDTEEEEQQKQSNVDNDNDDEVSFSDTYLRNDAFTSREEVLAIVESIGRSVQAKFPKKPVFKSPDEITKPSLPSPDELMISMPGGSENDRNSSITDFRDGGCRERTDECQEKLDNSKFDQNKTDEFAAQCRKSINIILARQEQETQQSLFHSKDSPRCKDDQGRNVDEIILARQEQGQEKQQSLFHSKDSPRRKDDQGRNVDEIILARQEQEQEKQQSLFHSKESPRGKDDQGRNVDETGRTHKTEKEVVLDHQDKNAIDCNSKEKDCQCSETEGEIVFKVEEIVDQNGKSGADDLDRYSVLNDNPEDCIPESIRILFDDAENKLDTALSQAYGELDRGVERLMWDEFEDLEDTADWCENGYHDHGYFDYYPSSIEEQIEVAEHNGEAIISMSIPSSSSSSTDKKRKGKTYSKDKKKKSRTEDEKPTRSTSPYSDFVVKLKREVNDIGDLDEFRGFLGLNEDYDPESLRGFVGEAYKQMGNDLKKMQKSLDTYITDGNKNIRSLVACEPISSLSHNRIITPEPNQENGSTSGMLSSIYNVYADPSNSIADVGGTSGVMSSIYNVYADPSNSIAEVDDYDYFIRESKALFPRKAYLSAMTSTGRPHRQLVPKYSPGGPYSEGGPVAENNLDPFTVANDLQTSADGNAYFMESYSRDDSLHLRQKAEELRHKADLLLQRNKQVLDSTGKQRPSKSAKTKPVCNNVVNAYFIMKQNDAAAATTTTAASMPLSPDGNDNDDANKQISIHAATGINNIDDVHARMERIRKNRAGCGGGGNGLFQTFSKYGKNAKGFFDKMRQSYVPADATHTEAAPSPLHTQTTIKSQNIRPRRQTSSSAGSLLQFTDKVQKKKRRRQRSRSRQRRNRITRE